MAEVSAHMSMSLDGYIAGPGNDPDNPLGDGGTRLHEWCYPLAAWRQAHGMEGGETGPSNDWMAAEIEASAGAVIMGKRMFDEGVGPWGPNPPFHVPVFVLSHTVAEPVEKAGGTTFHFVTDGIYSALTEAKDVAGDRDISVAGGADTVQQFLTADLLDHIDVHLVPITLGAGVRLFDGLSDGIRFTPSEVVAGLDVTHLRYTVVR